MLYKRFTEQLSDGIKLHIAVLHGNALEEAQKLIEKVKEELEPVELLVNITGPVLGIHTGPRALALCGYAEV
jgi:fatty acid-binding protein DegV